MIFTTSHTIFTVLAGRHWLLNYLIILPTTFLTSCLNPKLTSALALCSHSGLCSCE